MDPNAAICVKCGCAKGVGTSFCPNCGNAIQPGASFCPSCGYAIPAKPAVGAKSKLTAGLLGIFLGGFGIHNFYLGFTGKAVAQIVVTLVTCGAGSLWGFIEGILILCGSMNKDAQGNLLAE
jgi:TM2 domain-containing membrane protein YozV